jgi:hypothetical protein
MTNIEASAETRLPNGKRSIAYQSSVGNGSHLFSIQGLDGRSAPSRRFRDLVADISSDLGGYDRLSELEKQMTRRCASLSIMAEAIEANFVGSESIDVERYGQLCDRLGRLAQRLGLSRLARDVNKDLRGYLLDNPEPEDAA